MPRYDAEYVPRSALTVFAHPDDAEFTVGGTLVRWARAGCGITLLAITSGNAGTHDPRHTRESLARLREEEQRAAARVLGAEGLVFLGRDDCELFPTPELRRTLVREIRRVRPEVLVCGDPQAWFYGDAYLNHPDHRAAAAAALEAVFPCAETALVFPEEGPPHAVSAVYVATPLDPTDWIDITGTIDGKLEALRCHGSQLGGRDLSPRIREWGEAEALRARQAQGPGARPEMRYAEAFRIMRIRLRGKVPEE